MRARVSQGSKGTDLNPWLVSCLQCPSAQGGWRLALRGPHPKAGRAAQSVCGWDTRGSCSETSALGLMVLPRSHL